MYHQQIQTSFHRHIHTYLWMGSFSNKNVMIKVKFLQGIK